MKSINIRCEYINALAHYCTPQDVVSVALSISNYLETGERDGEECATEAGNMILDLICKDIDRQKELCSEIKRKSFRNA